MQTTPHQPVHFPRPQYGIGYRRTTHNDDGGLRTAKREVAKIVKRNGR